MTDQFGNKPGGYAGIRQLITFPALSFVL